MMFGMKMKQIIILVMALMINLEMSSQVDTYTIKLLTGSELKAIESFFVDQRIALFRAYPYLYDGNRNEEESYFGWFSKLTHTAIAVAYQRDVPIGFVSGTSFVQFGEHFEGSVDLFERFGLKPHSYFYISEVLILPEHRGNNLTKRLFDVLEEHAQKRGFRSGCLVTESHDSHPLMPIGYKQLDYLWMRLGFAKSSLNTKHDWLTLQVDGTTLRQDHVLDYWLKPFYIAQEDL
jgi:ribosomal protein S18 acetylase RimI-like enzyme